MKRPAFMFYPGDWQRDSALRACSIGARGLWVEMMCVMHQAEPYGYLVLNGNAIDTAQLARIVGAGTRETARWLVELETSGVYSKDAEGRIFSRRMVRDERVRESRAAGGKLGGNPALIGAKDNPEDDSKVNLPPNLQPTPSVAVAVAVASSENPSAKAGDESPSPAQEFLLSTALQSLIKQGVKDKSARSLIGKARSVHGDDRAASQIKRFIAEGTSDLQARIAAFNGSKGNGKALDADLSSKDYSAGLPAQEAVA